MRLLLLTTSHFLAKIANPTRQLQQGSLGGEIRSCLVRFLKIDSSSFLIFGLKKNYMYIWLKNNS